ncbi:peroxisomal 2,4 dienoyl-CoA reductase [Scheffersomyces xylosifermentans]|uniref:peroxisomal 2,4 dienoyl-CoA reductase n=1 Tax=Scheffersomyces xylosifermentans TaxID=1304137 RepID=UPI00315D8F1C
MVDYNVNGKVAVVTGGSRGLGLYCAETLALNGASAVVITSRKAKACEEAKQYLEKVTREAGKSCKIISLPADITVEEECNKFYEDTAKAVGGKVDILIANAGASWGAPLEDHDVSAVKKVLNLNVVAVFHTIKLFAPLLEKSGTKEDASRILIMSSIASINVNDPVGTYGYLASKAGVSHLGKNLAIQFGPKNINVNSLAPGFFPTKMSNGLLEVAGPLMIETNPKGRLGVKEDIQAATLFLCAKESNYINGIVLPIDGGAHLNPPASKF